MTHTPGPWEANTKGADAKVVCPDGRSFLIGDIIYHDENKANARLIAASPDLLEALKKAKFLMDEEPEEGHNIAYIVIANAIARVEGGLIRPITEGDNDDKV